MEPTILKLLRQEPVNRDEWHALFWSVHTVCLWDEKSHGKMYKALQEDIVKFIQQAHDVSLFSQDIKLLYLLLTHIIYQRVVAHEEDQSLLRAYISEWRKFFTQCSYLPMPFFQLESSLSGKTHSSVTKKNNNDDSLVRKVTKHTSQ